MMAAFILACSLVFLMQFFFSYCRSLIAASAKESLTPEVLDVTGITRTTNSDDFSRVVQILHLCPERPEERGEIRAISAYYHMLGLIHSTVARMVPSVRQWAEGERGQCTYFAAVVLGRRIAFSRNLFAQQMGA